MNINILFKFLLLRFVFFLNDNLIIIKSLNDFLDFSSKLFLVINLELFINFKVRENILKRVNIKLKTVFNIDINNFNFIFFLDDNLIIIKSLNNFFNLDNELFLLSVSSFLLILKLEKVFLKE